jgi:Ca-activated chloride channel homolog
MRFGREWALALLWIPFAWAWFEATRPQSTRARRLPALALKTATFALILLALAEPSIEISRSRVALGVLVDTSASVSPEDLARASRLVSSMNDNKGRNFLRVIPFARATRAPEAGESESPWRLRPTAGTGAQSTDLEAAIREATASLPSDMLLSLALITDGRENQGSVARAAWQAQQAGIPIATFAMQGRPRPPLRLESISVPGNAFTGEPIAIDMNVSSPAAASTEIELMAEGRSLGKSQVALATGVNPVRMHASLNTPGALDLSIVLRSPGSAELRYDQAVMLKRPKLLYVSQDPANIDSHLTGSLQSAQFEVTRATTLDAANFADFQIVVLNNWDFEHIADTRKDDLERYVREGGGLLLIGGEQNVYVEKPADKKNTEDALERALPAKLLPPRNNEGVVVVLIIDKSSSMEGPKMDLAKAAATGTVANLRPMDQVGVLSFDNSFAWVVPIRKADDRAAITGRISGIFANGGTQIAPALTEAYQRVLPFEAPYRHILLLTDGISEEGNSYDLSRTALTKHVTISTIGLGADVHKEYLQKIAELAGGKSYFLREPAGLEQIVLRDVMEHTGSTAVENALKAEVTKQTEIVDGVDFTKAPALKGYVRYETKPTAETILRLDRRDPLLARWQYGLGRAAIFTSDAKTRWATDWISWTGFDKFWTNTVRDLLPHAQGGEASAEYDSANGAIVVTYRLGPGTAEPAKIPSIFALGPDGFQKQIEVKKTAARTYRGELHIGARQGLFRIRPVEDSLVFPEVGLYRPESELAEYGSNPQLLKQVAEYTGGRFEPSTKDVFDAGNRSLNTMLSLWPGLLGLALALNLAELLMRKWSGLFGQRN